jgi:hypothetical protein
LTNNIQHQFMFALQNDIWFLKCVKKVQQLEKFYHSIFISLDIFQIKNLLFILPFWHNLFQFIKFKIYHDKFIQFWWAEIVSPGSGRKISIFSALASTWWDELCNFSSIVLSSFSSMIVWVSNLWIWFTFYQINHYHFSLNITQFNNHQKKWKFWYFW